MPGSKKAEKKLAARRKDYETLKSTNGRKLPGSQNIKKQKQLAYNK